jgi:D-alanyl-D-alanine carboxypeptidase
MTALCAIENSEPDEKVRIDKCAVGIEGSSAYLSEGEILTMEELTYALLLQSANDAAIAIACHIAGDVDSFVDIMNEKATSLGLSDTHFENPHGLDSAEHYTTASDLAKIAAAALNNPEFKAICSTAKKTFATEDRVRTYYNHNKLLTSYDGCVGIKTGYTKKSGRCLVSAAERDDLCFIAVTINSPNDWEEHKAMLNEGFATLEAINLCEIGDYSYQIPVIDGEKDVVTVENVDKSKIILPREKHEVDKQVRLCRYAIAPLNRGDVLGEVIWSVDGIVVDRIKLYATENIETKMSEGLFKKILSVFR